MSKQPSIWDRTRTVIGVIALFTALVGGVLIVQNEVNQRVVDLRNLPEDVSDSIQIESISVSDGGEVELRYYENKQSDQILIFFHGLGNPDTETPLKAAGLVNVIAPVYLSDGLLPIPFDDQELYDAVDLAMQEAGRLGFSDEKISVVGFSMGSAQAVYAATKYPDLNISIPIAAFTSFKDVCIDLAGASTCTLVPQDYLLSEEIAGDAVAPVHQYHSVDDKVVSFEEGKRLHSFLGSENKKFTQITGEHSGYDIIQIINENL